MNVILEGDPEIVPSLITTEFELIVQEDTVTEVVPRPVTVAYKLINISLLSMVNKVHKNNTYSSAIRCSGSCSE